ncbi:MAG: GYD domain-containing protein [Candidatus Marinimicrobia bacterium]|nr:GYD domain-containing protein [Candidatus Neomarinimicrobiota bacterium]
MPTYITLVNYTQKGIENIKESPARLDKVKEAMRAAGGELKAFYLAMGRYDMVVISEAPNDEAYAATMLAIGAAGAVRSETLKAFTEEEYRNIIASIP